MVTTKWIAVYFLSLNKPELRVSDKAACGAGSAGQTEVRSHSVLLPADVKSTSETRLTEISGISFRAPLLLLPLVCLHWAVWICADTS